MNQPVHYWDGNHLREGTVAVVEDLYRRVEIALGPNNQTKMVNQESLTSRWLVYVGDALFITKNGGCALGAAVACNYQARTVNVKYESGSTETVTYRVAAGSLTPTECTISLAERPSPPVVCTIRRQHEENVNTSKRFSQTNISGDQIVGGEYIIKDKYQIIVDDSLSKLGPSEATRLRGRVMFILPKPPIEVEEHSAETKEGDQHFFTGEYPPQWNAEGEIFTYNADTQTYEVMLPSSGDDDWRKLDSTAILETDVPQPYLENLHWCDCLPLKKDGIIRDNLEDILSISNLIRLLEHFKCGWRKQKGAEPEDRNAAAETTGKEVTLLTRGFYAYIVGSTLFVGGQTQRLLRTSAMQKYRPSSDGDVCAGVPWQYVEMLKIRLPKVNIGLLSLFTEYEFFHFIVTKIISYAQCY